MQKQQAKTDKEKPMNMNQHPFVIRTWRQTHRRTQRNQRRTLCRRDFQITTFVTALSKRKTKNVPEPNLQLSKKTPANPYAHYAHNQFTKRTGCTKNRTMSVQFKRRKFQWFYKNCIKNSPSIVSQDSCPHHKPSPNSKKKSMKNYQNLTLFNQFRREYITIYLVGGISNHDLRSHAIHCASDIQKMRTNLNLHNDTLSIGNGIT